MVNAIETEGLTKYYGKSRGIIDVSLVVETGQIFGFLGPNGAGKSTTIRLLLDLIRPTSGHARVLGLDVRRDRLAIDRRVSYVPGELSLYGDMTGRQLLTYLGNLQGKVDGAYRERLIERLELDPTKKIKGLSRGNKQKVGLVAAFMIRPDLLNPRRAHGRSGSVHPARVRRAVRGGPRRGADGLHLVPPAARSRAPVRSRGHHPRRPAADGRNRSRF